MEAIFTVYFLGLKRYDKKNKVTKEKTGEQGNILEILEIKQDNTIAVSTYFPTDEQILCNRDEFALMDKINLLVDIESASARPKLLAVQSIVEKANITYKPINK